MNIVTVDFETYYDKDFSLSKMTTEAYVRDPRFQVIGLGVKINDQPVDTYCGAHPDKFLSSLDWSKMAILCHNTAFDGAILSWHFGIRPKLWLDTLSMARALHGTSVRGSLKHLAAHYHIGIKGTEVENALGKRREHFSEQEMSSYMAYCANDVDLTYMLFRKMAKLFPTQELMAIDQTLRMYTEPRIHLDAALLEQHLTEVRQRKDDLLKSVDVTVDDLMSNNKFADVLRRLNVEPPTKVSPTTGKQTLAFAKSDKGMTDLLEHEDDRVQAVVGARLGVKSTIEETRTENLIGVAARGTLPVMLNYYGAHTGRFSGGDKLNLQNLPARGNNTIRRALRPPPGHKIIAADSSQIEARMVAWLAGQDDLVQAFREGRDVYSEFASEVYGRKITKADKVERFVGKTCILGLGYGMGAEKFRRTLEIGQAGISVKVDINEADRIVRLYRQKNFKIMQLWNECGSALTAMTQGGTGVIRGMLPFGQNRIQLPSKLHITYPLLRPATNGFEYIADARTYEKAINDPTAAVTYTKIYGGKVVENIVQALASIVIREQMVRIGEKGYTPLFQVHDEIVICAPDKDADAAASLLETIMSTPPGWAVGLPVACEVGIADNYGDT